MCSESGNFKESKSSAPTGLQQVFRLAEGSVGFPEVLLRRSRVQLAEATSALRIPEAV